MSAFNFGLLILGVVAGLIFIALLLSLLKLYFEDLCKIYFEQKIKAYDALIEHAMGKMAFTASREVVPEIQSTKVN